MKYVTKSVCNAVARFAITASVAAIPGMAEAGPYPYLGDIVAVAYGYCPYGWTAADGHLVQIADNSALFALFGTTYGGDGHTTFAVPDLRGRVAMGLGDGPGLTSRDLGDEFGSETQTLGISQLPSHSHVVNATNADGNFPGPAGKVLAAAPTGGTGNETIYSGQPADTTMSLEMVAATGGGAPISTQDPFLVLRYCVATDGLFPPRN